MSDDIEDAGIVLNNSVTIDKFKTTINVTIDLNGKTIDGSKINADNNINGVKNATFYMWRGTISLTINDSSTDGTGKIISGENYAIRSSGSHTFILNGGTIEERTDGSTKGLVDGGVFEMNGGTIKLRENTTTKSIGSMNKVVLNGGKIDGDFDNYVSEGTSYLILDDVLYVGKTYTENTDNDIKNATEVYKDNTVTIDSKVKYYTTNAKAIAAASAESAPFAIGDNKFFTTLERAVAAAQSGDTIKLLSNFTSEKPCSESVTINKDITFDLNGHTLTVEEDKVFAEVQNGVAFSLTNSDTSNPQAGSFVYSKSASNLGSTISLKPGADFSASNVKITSTGDNTSQSAGTFLTVAPDNDNEIEVVGGVDKATNTGKITLTNVTATIANEFFLKTGRSTGNYYASGYDVEVTGGEYTSSYTGADGIVFALAGAKGTFKEATVTTSSAVGVFLDNSRYDTPSTDEQKEAAASTPTAVFENCEFTVNGTANGGNTPTALIAVAGGNVAQIKGGTYTLGENSSGVGGLQVYTSTGGFIVDGGTFENKSNDTSTSEMFRFNPTDDNYKEDFSYVNNGDPVAVVKDGTFKGTLTKTAKTSSSDEETTHAGSLKVMGGTYKNSDDTANTDVSNYATAGLAVNETTGEIATREGTDWQVDETTNTTYHYVLAGATEAENVTLLSAMGVSDTPAAPANNCFFVLPMTATYTWGSGVDTLGYYLAKYTADGTSATLQAETPGVSVEEATTYLVTSTITDLKISGTRGINVDASGTNLALTKITGGDGGDTLKAGSTSATTLDGGLGDDKLIGNTQADTFIYSGGKDTVEDFGTGDIFSLTGFSPITDGTKISGNTTAFVLTFDDDNTLTFTGTTPATLKYGTGTDDTYSYAKDYVEKGKYATLAAGATSFDMGTVANSVNASAVTGALNITDNSSNNYIIGGQSANTFNYSGGGSDTIEGYDIDRDNVIFASALTAPTDPDSGGISYDGTNFVVSLGGVTSDSLTFKSATAVKLGNGTSTYYYEQDRVIVNGRSVTLGSKFSGTTFNVSKLGDDYANVATIDASAVTLSSGLNITGNSTTANSIIGAASGGTLIGGDGADTLQAGTGNTTLNGGAGNDSLAGGRGTDLFVYNGGTDSIKGYASGDLVRVQSFKLSDAEFTSDDDKITLSFGGDDKLIFEGVTNETAISVQSGTSKNYYTYAKDYFAHNKGITLAAGHSGTFDGTATQNANYATINAAAVTRTDGIEITGNANANYIVGSTVVGGTLDGGAGNDKLVVSERGDDAKYLFRYTEGRDEVIGFEAGDSIDVDPTEITAAKGSNGRLAFTFDKKSNSLTLRGDDDITKVTLSEENADGKYLTKDGYVDVGNTSTNARYLRLFASAKGRIDLTSAPYKDDNAITAIDAQSVKNQSVTLVGSKNLTDVAFASNNKRKDGFEYGGGDVEITGYEGGRDKIDLNGASLTSFALVENTTDIKDVVLNIGNVTGSISIVGAAGEEVLLRDMGSRGYKKMVFVDNGVVQNKAKNPTMATVSAGAGNYSFDDNAPTVKKIYVTDAAAGTSIRAGDKYNTVIDASKATYAVSLSGGAKNDKLIGSTVDADDLFVYTGGKDVIQNFGMGDRISIDSGTIKASLDAGNVKITAAKKSIKFKFGNKDVLTIKSNETMDGALKINNGDNIYFKNAIGKGESVTLTSAFSGTFKTQDSNRTALPTAATVNGGNVEKNLTFVGSSANETLIGGGKSNRKTMFRGGGGADSLVGGASKDTFFYAKGNTGDATIAKFDFANDKIKVSSGIISKIEKSGDSAIKFSMTNGKSTDAAVGSFTITDDKDGNTFDASNVAIKANNTYYWFATGKDVTDYVSASTGDTLTAGQLITLADKIKSMPTGCDVVLDLNYSTNLTKNDIVAVKVTTKPTTT